MVKYQNRTFRVNSSRQTREGWWFGVTGRWVVDSSVGKTDDSEIRFTLLAPSHRELGPPVV